MQISKNAILLIHCPDKPGIISSITNFIKENEGNITYLEQHVDPEEKVFFMRIEWQMDNFIISPDKFDAVFGEGIAKKFKMEWNVFYPDAKPRVAVFASKLTHCLYDILSRYKSDEWNIEIPIIFSNHAEINSVASGFNVPFVHLNVDQGNKDDQEKIQLELLEQNKIDFIVLARYMQILSPAFVAKYPGRIINIHHSFLPAFPGAKPYHSAYYRGVKIIGATSHFVTDKLDEGPIIEQDVVRVSHLDSVSDMIRKGRDLEKIVLSRAIFKYIQRKILVYKNKTVVFN